MAASNSRKGLLALLGVVVVGAAGWYGWQYYSGQTPASAPVAKAVPKATAKPVDQDKLIHEMLALTGMQRQLEQLPDQVRLGMATAPGSDKLPPNVAKALEKITIDAFNEEKIGERMVARLKENFNETHVQAMLRDFSTPLAKRMVALETNLGTPADQAAFFQALTTRPLPASRISALQALDQTVNASGLGVEMANTTSTTMIQAMVGNDPQALAQVKAALEQQRAVMEQHIRDSVMTSFAYLYRNASDDDINAYAKLYATPHVKWFSDIAISTLKDGMKSASARIGERFGALLRSMTPQQTASSAPSAATPAPAPSKPAAAPAEEKTPATPAAHKPRKPGGDARKCLTLEDSRAIAKCAEQYH